VSGSNFSPASLAAGILLVAFGAWVLTDRVTFDALFPALIGGVGLILLASGLARRR
jgi:hypothetical protein